MKLIDAPIPLLSTADVAPDVATRHCAKARRANFADWATLAKARLTLMVLITVAVGFIAGSGGVIDWLLFTHALAGTALVACGASALNQVLEIDADAKMRRTQRRPLPAGRMQPSAALRFGVLTACAGLVYLAFAVNSLTALVALVTLTSYVFLYTPLKRVTAFNTLVGAVPGALPPVIGWAAATDSLSIEAGSLFLILFLWQFPHFWAIAWLYRDDYARAGLKMLPESDTEGGRMTGRLILQSCLALTLASLGPALVGLAGQRYALCAVAFGGTFALFALRFLLQPSQERARHVLWASLVYLPVILLALLFDGPLFGVFGT